MGLRFKRNSVDKKSIRENNRLIGRHRRRWKWTTMSWIRSRHNSDWWIEKEGFWLVVRERKWEKGCWLIRGKRKCSEKTRVEEEEQDPWDLRRAALLVLSAPLFHLLVVEGQYAIWFFFLYWVPFSSLFCY
jgi:hypothetical protein